MKKVLLCSPYAPSLKTPGGISVWAQNVVSYNVEHNDEILMEVLPCDRSQPMNENTGRLRRLYYGIKDYVKLIGKIRSKLRTNQYQVIHVNTTASISSLKDYVICKMAKKYAVSSVLHYHFGRIPELIQKNNWEWKLLYSALKIADKVIVMDNLSYEALLKLGVENVVNIPNPYSPALETTIENSKNKIERVQNRVLFASRVFRKKGIYELVEACKQISGIHLRIVGPYDDSDRQSLERLAGSSDWLEFVGPVPHSKVIEELLGCDLFVLPTYTEGFPNIILESMLCKTPTVVTPVGAIPEMLDFEGEPCGISIRPNNVEDIVKAINSYFKEKDKTMVQRGYTRVKAKYSLPVVCQQLYSVWKNL